MKQGASRVSGAVGERFDRPAALREVGQLVEQLRPGRTLGRPLEEGASLARDLGLDSLTQVELLLRIQRQFGVDLPEQLLGTAETVGALLDAIERAEPERPPSSAVELPAAEEEALQWPLRAGSLLDVVDWYAARHPDRLHICLHEDEGPATLTYGQLAAEAGQVAAGLAAHQVAGRAVGLMLPTSLDYFRAFVGVLMAGGVPVPLYPPFRPSGLEEHLRRQAGILGCAEAPLLITVPEVRRLAGLLRSGVRSLREVVTVEQLARAMTPEPCRVAGGTTGLLQFTSGSTGAPKGVVLSHDNVLSNVRAMGEALAVGPGDAIVSWLPLYHDMGLIGCWLGSLYHALPLQLMSPLRFLSRPARWLQTIARTGGTISTAPNFAYELCVNKIEPSELHGLDLSRWRLALNGAEPVSVRTLEAFADRFAPFGFRRTALMPVYGLAESAVGLAFPPAGRAPRIDRIRGEALQQGRAEPAPADASDVVRLASCGHALPGHALRVADDRGQPLGERQVGRLLFRGPSVTAGYLDNPEATRRLRCGDWLDSGDLAYQADGELYIAGRVKDVIIRGGRNIHPQQLEEAVGLLPGVRTGCVVAFGVADPLSGTERLVVAAERRPAEPVPDGALTERINAAVLELLGQPVDEVLLVPPRTLLKTSSGKLRRAANRERYLAGRLLDRPPAPWLQRLRLARRELAGRLRARAARWVGGAYAVWAWGLFALIVGPLWLMIAACPRPRANRRLLRTAARLLALLAGVPLRVEGLEHLPVDGPYQLAINHTSYLDVFAVVAALPPGPVFVAKREFEQSAAMRIPLRRLGALLVERADARRGVADVDQLAEALARGESLITFPEGTFEDTPALRPFRLGAFVASARTGTPIVPVALRGVREILPAYVWRPRPGRVTVTVGAPVWPAGEDWPDVIALQERVRGHIRAHCGEREMVW